MLYICWCHIFHCICPLTYRNLRSVFQALKKSYFVTDEEISDQERRMTQEHIHTDSGVTVVKRDSGRVNRVQVTYAEF